MFIVLNIVLIMSLNTAMTPDEFVKILDKKLEEKLKPFYRAVDELKLSVDFVSEKFDSLTKRVLDIEGKYKEVLLENTSLKDEVLRLTNITNQHAKEMNEMEQYTRRDCVEISGIPVQQHEDTKDLVIQVGSLMGLDIDERDISVSHRLPSKSRSDSYSSRLRSRVGSLNSSDQHQKIIVKFVRKDIKTSFYGARKHLKDKSTRDLGLSRSSVNKIYVSESLTAKNKILFNECLKFKKEHRYNFIWTHNGRIYLRKSGDDPAHLILRKEQLSNLPS